MKIKLIFLILVVWNCNDDQRTIPDYNYCLIRCFQGEIDHCEEQYILEQLEKEADLISMKNKGFMQGNIQQIHDSFIVVQPLLSDTFLKVYYTDIDSIYETIITRRTEY